MDEPFYSFPQAQAELGGASRGHVYNLINRGDLELVKLGRKSLITGRSISKLKARLLEQVAA
mgnify:CR=1 FL=1